MTRFNQTLRDVASTLAKPLLFAAGAVALLCISNVVVWLARENIINIFRVIPPGLIASTVEPMLVLVYLVAVGHLAFDFRPAFDTTEPGTRRALQAAAVIYGGGFLLFAAVELPTSIDDIETVLFNSRELWTDLLPIFVPTVYAIFTTRGTLPALKSAAVLTGTTMALSELVWDILLWYLDDDLIPLEYVSPVEAVHAYPPVPAYPPIDITRGLLIGMFFGVLFAAAILGARSVAQRANQYRGTV